MKSLVLPATEENMPRLLDWVQEAAEAAGLDHAASLEMLLAAEEMIVNIVHYAYPKGAGEIRLDAGEAAGGGFRLRIEDQGVAFNPLDRPDPDTSASLEDRPIGGLGIMLSRLKTDSLRYERVGGANVVVMEKRPCPSGHGA